MSSANFDDLNISIAGTPLSLKVAISNVLSQEYGYEVIGQSSIAAYVFQNCNESFSEFNAYAYMHEKFDDIISGYYMELGRVKQHTVFVSPVAYYFCEKTFRVFCYSSYDAALSRIDCKNATLKLVDYNRKYAAIKAHLNKAYGLDIASIDSYDLILDTSNITPEEAARIIMFYARLYINNPNRVLLCNPSSVLLDTFASNISRDTMGFYLDTIERDVSIFEDGFYNYDNTLILKDGRLYATSKFEEVIACIKSGVLLMSCAVESDPDYYVDAIEFNTRWIELMFGVSLGVNLISLH